GDIPSNIVIAPTTRLGNYTQISGKTIEISGTSQAVVAAGGSNKMGYQLAKKAKELKRDMEGILTNNVAKAAGSSSTARKSAGLPAWIDQRSVSDGRFALRCRSIGRRTLQRHAAAHLQQRQGGHHRSAGENGAAEDLHFQR